MPAGDNNVSILVFVELALDGCAGKVQEDYKKMFQSLFSWNLLLMFVKIGDSLRHDMFQSLFSWNLLLMFFQKP